MEEKIDGQLKTYLRRLGWALARMPAQDREEILEETRSHILDRVDQGLSVPEVLATLGKPETYGALFIDDMEITEALASQGVVEVGAAVLKRVHRSATAAGAAGLTVLANRRCDHNFDRGSPEAVRSAAHRPLGLQQRRLLYRLDRQPVGSS